MKKALYALLTTDTELTSLGFTSFFGSTALDSPQMPKFAVIKWGIDTPVFGKSGITDLAIWYYDEPGSYVDIDKALARTRDLLLEAVHLEGEDGDELTLAGWNGFSEELYDDIYKKATRYTAFRVI